MITRFEEQGSGARDQGPVKGLVAPRAGGSLTTDP